jgi:hypothetical protein
MSVPSAKVLTDGNYNGYLRSVGYKVAEELRVLRTIHICPVVSVASIGVVDIAQGFLGEAT